MTFTKILTNAFTAKRGLAIGIALSGTGLCAFAVPIYGALLIEQFGWRGGFVGLALLPALIAMPVAIWLLPADPARPARRLTRTRRHAPASPVCRWKAWK
jgi:predicted MFS family arabinose efflux permease